MEKVSAAIDLTKDNLNAPNKFVGKTAKKPRRTVSAYLMCEVPVTIE